MTHDQKEIERLLARRIGLDPVTLGPHLLLRAARRRMAELGLDDLDVYASRVVQSEAELQELVEEVVVPESWFFRDDRPFRWLAAYVRERWVGDPARPPLRILSLPCAGGEEPYSIAITMRDVGLPARRFQVDGVDVSARRLAVAGRGVYSANAFRGSELGGRVQYFRAHGQGYEVDPAIRATVQFHQASALDPKLLEGSLPYDVVFCRNLLIYLDAPARACVLAVLDRLLAADGVLFIGHADRLDLTGEPSRFAAAGEPGCFAFRKLAPHRGTPTQGLPAPTLDPPLTQPNPERRKSGRIPAESIQPDSSFILQPSSFQEAFRLAGASRRAGQPGPACGGDRDVRAAPSPEGARPLGVLFDGDDLPGGRRTPSGRRLLPQDGLPGPEA